MTVLKASGLRGLLDKARKIGILEESVDLLDHHLVLQNLPPDSYTEIYQELSSLEENVEYMHAHQIEHVCRSLVEIDGEDLREVKYIEVEEDDPKNSGTKVVIKVPRHEWVRDNLVSTWGREAIHTIYRKFMDLAGDAEKVSKEGVTFKVVDETDEEKFRRLLIETMAAGEDLPDDMKEAILQEHGLLLATSKEELEKATENAKRFLEEQREKQQQEEQAAQEAQEETLEDPVPAQVPSQILQATQETPQETPQEILARRVPLNRTPIQAPIPQTQEVQVKVVNKRPPPPPLDKIAPPLNERASKRAAEYAALEAEASLAGVPLGHEESAVYRMDPNQDTVLEESIKDELKPTKVPIDRQPRGGVNRKFVDGTKGLNPRNR